MTSKSTMAAVLTRLRDDHRGVAAIEFAIVLPFMLVLYIGGVELGDGMAIQVKVTDTTHIVADLVTQQTTTTTKAMVDTILGASSATMAPYSSPPYSAANLVVTVSEVSTNASGAATVTWSDSLNGTKRPVGAGDDASVAACRAGEYLADTGRSLISLHAQSGLQYRRHGDDFGQLLPVPEKFGCNRVHRLLTKIGQSISSATSPAAARCCRAAG